ncbi:MAG: hypothetical protein K6E11_01355 [Bacilli bacterium]|nr:hypothetical protein [Bacilli bacterium]
MKKHLALILVPLLLIGCNSKKDADTSDSPKEKTIEDYYYDKDVIDENDQTYEHRLVSPKEVIDNYTELRDAVDYYAFYKDPSFDIKLSDSFASSIDDETFMGSIYWQHTELVNGVMGIDGKSVGNNTYHIEFELYENAKNSYKARYLQGNDIAYVDPIDGVVSSNTFASDDSSRPSLDVWSTQQLWYGVEHGYHVIPMSESPAANYYQKAKDLLNDLIEPTDSELTKIKKLFEYITHHAVYDYGALNHDTGISNEIYPDRDAATDKCYFLEGFFDNHIVVCDGFAKTMTLLGRMVGLDIYRVISPSIYSPTSKADAGHAYCYVNYEGKIYTCCPTWSQTTSTLGYSFANHYTFMTYGDALKPYNAGASWDFISSDAFIKKQNQIENDYQNMMFNDITIGANTYHRDNTTLSECEVFEEYLLSQPKGSYLTFRVAYSYFVSTLKQHLINSDCYYTGGYLNNDDAIEIIIYR